MERSPGVLGECLKEDGDEGLDILRSVFGGLHNLTIIRIRETNSDATGSFNVSDIKGTEAV